MHRTTLEAMQRVLGEEHPDTLGSMDNLAIALDDAGRHAKAAEVHCAWRLCLVVWKCSKKASVCLGTWVTRDCARDDEDDVRLMKVSRSMMRCVSLRTGSALGCASLWVGVIVRDETPSEVVV